MNIGLLTAFNTSLMWCVLMPHGFLTLNFVLPCGFPLLVPCLGIEKPNSYYEGFFSATLALADLCTSQTRAPNSASRMPNYRKTSIIA